ncbi:MAG TPA: alpha/beta hydrolase [Microbacterium sp.]|nr:alpha/beta hydrolase [Microbacterium sp.]
MNRTARRILGAVAGLAAASLVLSGCLSSLIPADRPSVTAAPDTSGVPAELLPYYSQVPDWSPCDADFECTTVTVPLDYANPAGGDIELAVVRHRATGGDAIGSLLTNPGGPGAGGVDFVKDSLDYVMGSRIRADYDVIGFDPRGVGQSTAVACYDPAQMDAYLFDIPADPRGSDGWTRELEEASRGFAEACDGHSDGILPFITTENSARDMDVLRAVLGDTALNYLGFSYGTFLGATYAKLFPDRVGRLVLDGAIDPSVSGLDVSTTQGLGFESALRAYMASCLDGEKCPFAGSVDDAMADLATLLASVDRRPIANSDGRMLGADTLVTAIITPLYSEGNWPALTTMLTDVLAGSAEYAFFIADLYFNREDGAYLDNQTEAFRAYNCMDYPRDHSPADLDAAYALLDEKAPTIAPYWKGPDPCDQWLYPATGVREPITAEGAAPIVVVGTTNDPATPYEWSVALADQLSSGVLVSRFGEGHTGYNKGSACVDNAVEAYLIDGTVPADGLECH